MTPAATRIMKRLWLIWLIFALCIAVGLGAMVWISITILRLDRAELDARRNALVEENVRLALWRMDSLVAPLVAQEMARPYWNYSPFAPVDGVYGRLFNEIPPGEVFAPSPLLSAESPLINVHCEILPGNRFQCPQVPTGNMRDLATRYTTRERIAASEQKLGRLRELLSRPEVAAALPAGAIDSLWITPTTRPALEMPDVRLANDLAQQPEQQQAARSRLEFNARNTYQQQASNYEYTANRGNVAATPNTPAIDVHEGLMKPLWIDGELILARRVTVNGQPRIQGCWLDWPQIRASLVQNCTDLLPHAELAPDTSANADEQDKSVRRLAALPVRLAPGAVPVHADAASPVRITLMIAWICALAGALAVALLLSGAITLSERRGAFVSAVTHELRTPLTTVSMYAEMLEEGMVQDESKRKHYLGTLRAEAERLGHLVENVLAYSRIERGKLSNRLQTVPVEQLLDFQRQRLAARAEQAGLQLHIDIHDSARTRSARADASAVEQILFNLVDNAGKYARPATDPRLHLEARADDATVTITLHDHGPGISASDAKKLFRPFSKSAKDAANSAPGVGLGLALSRRLAREMHGDLHLTPSDSGARFTLTLPAAS